MKRNIKMFITAFAVCAVSAMAVMFSGCSVKDTLNQLKCKHEYGEVVVIEESTCLEQGKGEKTCSKCNRVKEVKLELKEHTAVFVDVVSPTCTEKGITDGTVCSVCETTISGFQEIPALGHVVVKDSAVEATCLDTGLTEGEHCSRCNEVLKKQEKISATGHNLVILEAVEPTCKSEGKTQGVWCDRCKTVFTAQDTISYVDHVYEDGACVVCGSLEYIYDDESNYTEEDVVVGDKVAGYWYRITRADSHTGPEINYGFSFKLDTSIAQVISSSSFPPELTVTVYASPKGNTLTLNICSNIYSLKGELQAVVTDDYIDIFVPVDEICIMQTDDGSQKMVFMFTDSFVVSSVGSQCTVKRLVPKIVTAE